MWCPSYMTFQIQLVSISVEISLMASLTNMPTMVLPCYYLSFLNNYLLLFFYHFTYKITVWNKQRWKHSATWNVTKISYIAASLETLTEIWMTWQTTCRMHTVYPQPCPCRTQEQQRSAHWLPEAHSVRQSGQHL